MECVYIFCVSPVQMAINVSSDLALYYVHKLTLFRSDKKRGSRHLGFQMRFKVTVILRELQLSPNS